MNKHTFSIRVRHMSITEGNFGYTYQDYESEEDAWKAFWGLAKAEAFGKYTLVELFEYIPECRKQPYYPVAQLNLGDFQPEDEDLIPHW